MREPVIKKIRFEMKREVRVIVDDKSREGRLTVVLKDKNCYKVKNVNRITH